ncbi:MAG: hypothetical protein KA731_00635 [Candidatus Moranbacteria bacterium]|nr:hypothetical protein [Candidatus Moranbacteria bacterium]MBP6033925.1 hypothetical protein [Candidatus Moranbacteria bacterium]MBP7695616.1 hypothetical protein [Candidatus Moranbacteria bacterium]
MNEYITKNLGLIMLVSIIVTMGLTYWFGIRSLDRVIGTKQENIQQSVTIRENRERQLGKLGEYENQYNRILEEEEKLGVFTEKGHMIDFIKQLEALAKEKGVKIVIEAREAPPVTKAPVKAAATDAEKTAETGGAEKPDAKKKDPSIIGNLPTQEYTRLALRVSGETGKVIEYLHLVETLPVALDVIALDAVRKERELSSVETVAQDPVPVTEAVTHEDAGLFVVVPEPVIVPVKAPEHFFELEVVADTIVYHHPNR